MGGDTRSNRQMEARSKVNSQSPGNYYTPCIWDGVLNIHLVRIVRLVYKSMIILGQTDVPIHIPLTNV